MPKAATVSPDREEITVDTAQADDKKAIRRESRPQRTNDDEGGEPSAWIDRNKAVQRRMASFGRNLTNDLTRQFSQRQADNDARWQKELAKRDEEINRLKTGQSNASTDAQHEAEIASLQTQLEAAHEAGDSKEQARITTLISRKEAAHLQKKTDAITGASAATARQEREAEEQRQAANSTANTNSKAQRFISATPWWDDPEFAAEKGAANAIHAELVKAGSDPESDAHYRRLNKALKKKFPTLELTDPEDMYNDILGLDDDDDDEDDTGLDRKGRKTRQRDNDDEDEDDEAEQARTNRRAPVQQFQDRGNPGASPRNRTVRLSDADIATMRAMKLDPSNDTHVKAFATSKAERLAQES